MQTNAVEVALHRALARLRVQFEEQGSSSRPTAERSDAIPIEP